MKKFGIIVKVGSAEAAKLGSEIAAWLVTKECEVFTETTSPGAVSPATELAPKELAATVDNMVVLGGDGTMLHAARMLDGRKVPIVGVNMGGLGFMTAVTVDEAMPLLESVVAGTFNVEERMMLSVEHRRDGKLISTHRILNDAVVKSAAARLIRVETRINNEYVTTYRADGLIVATPTGSTAYALSSAGPILYPTIHSIIVVPICPFNLTNRPVVIPDWMSIDIKVCPEQENIVLIMDGQVDVNIVCNDLISIKRATESVYLVKYEGKSYFDILRERLMWEVKVDKED
jgi:NAD+ kinase